MGKQKTENKTESKTQPVIEPTMCFTYQVTMLVQVIGTDEYKAQKQLDEQGGFLTKREVTLVDAKELCSNFRKD